MGPGPEMDRVVSPDLCRRFGLRLECKSRRWGQTLVSYRTLASSCSAFGNPVARASAVRTGALKGCPARRLALASPLDDV